MVNLILFVMLENKQEAADLLGTIAVKLEKLVNIINDSGYETIYNKYMKPTLDKETQNNNKKNEKIKILLKDKMVEIVKFLHIRK